MKKFVSGQFIGQGSYKSFVPNTISRSWQIDDMQVLQLLSQADRELGRLDMFSKYVDIDLYISMHIAWEARQSTRIEGTQTSMEEVFLGRDDISHERRSDWEEVQNYIAAMNEAMQLLPSLPFSTRLIRKVHHVLLQGVRGQHKLPGEYRSSQNWIGGASLSDAVFVPPPHSMVGDLMSDLEKFANDPGNLMPELLKAALIHYQFETIHPFLDGNGRVGRLLIPLLLVNKGIIERPVLYLSDFFERNRMLYYDNLMRVRTHNDLGQWFRFFLTGIVETSRKSIQTFDGILQLQRRLDEKLKSLGSRSADARKVLDALFRKPAIDAPRLQEIIGKSKVSAYKLIDDLERLGILEEITGAQRGRVFVFREYLELYKG